MCIFKVTSAARSMRHIFLRYANNNNPENFDPIDRCKRSLSPSDKKLKSAKKRQRKEEDHPVNYAAKKFHEMYNQYTRFQICAICGEEGPRTGSATVESCLDRLDKSKIKEYFEKIQEVKDTKYDEIYCEQLNIVFEDGSLKGIKDICSKKHLRHFVQYKDFK